MPIFRCPECEAQIDELCYQQEGFEYGTCSLTHNRDHVETNDFEQNDTEFSGDIGYTCPECEADLSLSSIRVEAEDGDEEEAENEMSSSLAEADGRRLFNPRANPSRVQVDFCTKCRELFEIAELHEKICEACQNT
jgi:ssDNA-binding Zn-finger/Zn-ribbon topoisomerase 1